MPVSSHNHDETCRKIIGGVISEHKLRATPDEKAGRMLVDFGIALQAQTLVSRTGRAVRDFIGDGGTRAEAKALLKALFP
jgi:hypothetical protein